MTTPQRLRSLHEASVLSLAAYRRALEIAEQSPPLLGPLLALYGQTYQTGADPWELFFT